LLSARKLILKSAQVESYHLASVIVNSLAGLTLLRYRKKYIEPEK
jgi:hypothetical protein